MRLRLLAYALAGLAVLSFLLPLALLASHVLGGKPLVRYSLSVVGVEPPDRLRVALTATYEGPVPISKYSVRVEPSCPGCAPAVASGDELRPGSSLRLEFVVSGRAGYAVRVVAEGYLAGIYRFKAVYSAAGAPGA